MKNLDKKTQKRIIIDILLVILLFGVLFVMEKTLPRNSMRAAAITMKIMAVRALPLSSTSASLSGSTWLSAMAWSSPDRPNILPMRLVRIIAKSATTNIARPGTPK